MRKTIPLSSIQWAVHVMGVCLLPGLLVLGHLYAPFVERGPVLCLWRRFFDWHCLGCGLTRALCLFADGQWAVSVHTNWLIIPVLLAALIIFVRSLIALIGAFCEAKRVDASSAR
ncbi:MAG: DUF2752 domain-containing protein [Lentisphaerae bacterium]|nr:DUF2752 domain-containing protein [Lentisphaerota bacterium]